MSDRSVVLHRRLNADWPGQFVYETDDGYRVVRGIHTRLHRTARIGGHYVHERDGWDVYKGRTLTVDEAVSTLAKVREIIAAHREGQR